MYCRQFAPIVAVAAVLGAHTAFAQTPRDGGPDPSAYAVKLGPLLLQPRVQLSNLGIDTNVFNEPADQNPKADLTATLTPTADLWLRLGPSWLQANVKEDFVWFEKYTSERSVNGSYALNWRLRLNRLAVDLSPTYLRTRDRPGFEIDKRSLRREYGGKGVAQMRIFGKTYFGVSLKYLKVDFDKDAIFLDANLHAELNRTSTTGAVSLRYDLTPLTTLTFDAGQEQDRFEFSPLRDSDSFVANAAVSFEPHALIRGSASIGYRNFRLLTPGTPGYTGPTALGNLSYTLLGATRFDLQFKRNIEYSYDVNQPFYLETGVSGEVAQHVFGPVDVVGRAGTSSLAYSERVGAVLPISDRVDYVHQYGGGIGYRLSRELRIGFNVDQQHRLSSVADRRYDALRYGTSVTYAF